ncbi:MAG: DNA ligase D [Bdellovibrio sp.]
MSPQLAELVDEPPSGERWLHETKFDGYRIQAHVEKKKVNLYSRNGLDWTTRFSKIAQAIENIPVKNIIVDGEVVWLDDKGRSDFQKLQNFLKAKEGSSRLVYYVFDLLFLNGEDYREMPLYERKIQLEKIIKNLHHPLIRYTEHFEGDPKPLFEAACSYDLEGLLSKDRESAYVSKRSSSWMKTKCKKRQEFVVGGFTSGEGARANFGALLLGAYEDGKLRYVGRVGTGFTMQSIAEVRKQLMRRKKATSPFDINSPKDKGVHWVKPEMVAEVNFGNWTSDGILRTPVFLGLREDKFAKEIKVEKEKSLDTLGIFEKKGKRKKTEKPVLAISNPEKVFFHQEGITKLQVARYFQDFAKFILPHISERPLALYRCPDGTEGECFFQKRLVSPIPSGLVPITIKEKDEVKEFITLDSEEGLLSLSQLGAFELHPWGCHIDKVENPDVIIMDIDPGPGITWPQVIEAALDLKEILDAIKLKSFIKVTGGKGLHIHIPISPIYSWDQIKNFAKTLGRELAHRYGDRYTVSFTKKAREKKVYIDYLRNSRGATAVAPYSLRASKISAIAMPISWEELPKIKSSNQFTLDKAYEYLNKRKLDPWRDYFKKEQKISILESAAGTATKNDF